MNEQHDFEERLRMWLDADGPSDAPDRVITASLAEAAGVRRSRAWPRPLDAVLANLGFTPGSAPSPQARAGTLLALLLTFVVGAIAVAGVYILLTDDRLTNGSIAVAVDGDIWLLTGEPGKDAIPRTRTPGIDESAPTWSADGRRLAYWVTESDSAEIHVYDAVTDRTTAIEAPAGLVLPLHDSIIGWSPDGRRIAAPARGIEVIDGITHVGIPTVAIFDVETGTGERIAVDGEAWSFGWAPNTERIGLLYGDDAYLYDVDTHALTPIVSGKPDDIGESAIASAIDFVFSSDGSALLMTTASDDGAASGDIWTIDLRGDSSKPVVSGTSNDLAPTESRDGSMLAFIRSNALTAQGAAAGPRTDGLAFDRSSEVLVIPAGGGEARSLIDGIHPEVRWSPDGRRMLAKSLDGSELLIVDLDRPDGPIRITFTEGSIDDFDWGPIPP